MPTIHYYGKKTKFIGKTLFEILANLRNFGVNRMLIKQEELLLYPGKPSYYIVKKVEPVMDQKLQEGAIYAERIFKGSRMPGLVFVDDTTWHTDWQLIPRDEESKYRVENPPDFRPAQMVKDSFEVPPLMDAFLKRHLKNRGQNVPQKRLQIQLDYKPDEIDYGIDFSKPLHTVLSNRFRRNNKRG